MAQTAAVDALPSATNVAAQTAGRNAARLAEHRALRSAARSAGNETLQPMVIYASPPQSVLGLLPWARDFCDLDKLQDISDERLPFKAAVAFPKKGRPREWGKGSSVDGALASALMERVERHVAAHAHLSNPGLLIHIAPSEIEIVYETIFSLTPTNISRFLVSEPEYKQSRSAFVLCRRFSDNEDALIPASRVLLGYHDRRFHDFGDSTGLAAGSSADEALLQAIFEVYERDLFHKLIFGPSLPRRVLTGDELADLIPETAFDEIAASFAIEVAQVIHNAPCEVATVRLIDKGCASNTLLSQLHVGVCSTLGTAIRRGISESIQSHLIERFKRSRGDFAASQLSRSHDLSMRELYDKTQLAPSAPPSARGSDRARVSAGDHREQFARMASFYAGRGGSVYTHEFHGLPAGAHVVRVIVTNAAPNFMLLGYYPRSFKARVGENLEIFRDVIEDVQRGNFQEQTCFSTGEDGNRKAIPSPSVRLPVPKNSLRLTASDDTKLTATLADVLRNRQSRRRARRSITATDIGSILNSGVGFRGFTFDSAFGLKQKRSYASPGSCHSLEFFVAVRSVQGISSGLHYYANIGSTLEQISERDGIEDIFAQFRGVNDWASKASALIFAAAVPSRLRFKYGPNSRRFAEQEYGHASAYFALIAEALKVSLTQLGTCECEPAISYLRACGAPAYVIGASALT